MDLSQIVFLSILILSVVVLFIVAYPLYYSVKERLKSGGVKKSPSAPAVRLEPVVNQGIQFVNSEAVHLPQQQAFDFNTATESQSGGFQQPEKPTNIRKSPKFEVFSNIPTAPRQGAYVNNYRNWSSNWN